MVHGLETIKKLNKDATKLNKLRSVQELIVWKDVSVVMPDDGMTVLIFVPDNSEPVFLGWHDVDDGWYFVDGSKVEQEVTHWDEVPVGPKLNGVQK